MSLMSINFLFSKVSLLTTPSNVMPLHPKHTFLTIIRILSEGDGNGIESRLSFKFTQIFKKSRSEKVKFFKKVATVPLFRKSCSLRGGSAAQNKSLASPLLINSGIAELGRLSDQSSKVCSNLVTIFPRIVSAETILF